MRMGPWASTGKLANTTSAANARAQNAVNRMQVPPTVVGRSQIASGPGGVKKPSFLELLIEDLTDEAVDRYRIEVRVGRNDHARVDDLALSELLQDPLQVVFGRPGVPPDLQVFALQHQPRGIAEAEDAGHQRVVHELALAEQLAIRGPVTVRGDHHPGGDPDPPADFHGPSRLLTLGPHQDVGQRVVAGDDSGHRTPHHPRLLEDVAQPLGIIPGSRHRALSVRHPSVVDFGRVQVRGCVQWTIAPSTGVADGSSGSTTASAAASAWKNRSARSCAGAAGSFGTVATPDGSAGPSRGFCLPSRLILAGTKPAPLPLHG